MFRNYLKIAARNLWRNKGFSAINIIGLAIGLAVCLLITLYVTDELSYDRFNEKAGRIYRVNADFLVNGSAFQERYTPGQLGAVLQQEFPGIENYVRILAARQGILVKKGEQTFREKNIMLADSTLFNIFTVPMIAGDPRTALTQPDGMVISESAAVKYFGSTDVVGKTLLTDNTITYRITGVIRNFPAASHIHPDFIKAMVGTEESRNDNWMSDIFDTYLLAKPGPGEQEINRYLREATLRYMDKPLKAMTGSSIAEIEKSGGHFGYYAMPLTKIHLYSTLTNEIEPSGNIQYVYIFLVAAVLILLIACVNFMNLSTARSAGRSREVGVRKVLGSHRGNLVAQFLVESVVTSSIALVLAGGIAVLLLPFLNQMAGKEISTAVLLNRWLVPGAVGVVLVVGFLAGSYPAFYLSSFEPVKVLKGKLAAGMKAGGMRNALVVFQFSTAIILMIGTLVIYSQLDYIRNRKLGYNREQVLVLHDVSALGTHAKTLRQEVLQLPGVASGTMTRELPTTGMMYTGIYSKDAASSAGQVTGIFEWLVDADYIPTLGMRMAAGRNFMPNSPSDSSAVVINETAAKLLGFTDINDKVLYSGHQPFRIIGVVKDFNAGSLRKKIPPIVMRLVEVRENMAFRISTANVPALIAQIEQKYHAAGDMKGQPFHYSFLDDNFNQLYKSEERTGRIFVSFAFFAIFISCLGLFGLVTYAAEQRTREIGIRKVLGASITGIVTLLSKDFLKLVVVAILVASPLAWLIMERWLQNFAYRISIGGWVFVVTALVAILLTLATVSFRAVKAALVNPVKSLS
ncbi:MAG TPA: ABC transporter permease [Chitinophaga sp.]|uniref:ABC transporter permease n=1 Tax=Chitinophaga sp. TaxID=1869181 RepID=UPI002B9EF9C4|nr:ABC transporter permease [Chitinophaga sp.]HVI45002.1 ABC transporter permease [Chitinophaga sp.]